ncbi:hypothetical protein GFV12_07580 [Desulfurobacterium thermolithotrophum]|nr:hypothetical protein [Desulfurobacterium thermolithotrophum]
MGIYDRDYYKEKKESNKSSKIFTIAKWIFFILLAIAFAVYVLAIFSE